MLQAPRLAKPRVEKPTVQALLGLLSEHQVIVVKRCRIDGQEVLAKILFEEKKIYVSLANEQKVAGLVLALIHELIHAWLNTSSEPIPLRWEGEFYKSRTLREACLTRLLQSLAYKITGV
jgi:hypothetical protein